MKIDSNTINEIEASLPRPATITSENRTLVRRWITAHGIPYSIAGNLPLAALNRIYNAEESARRLEIEALMEPAPSGEHGGVRKPAPAPITAPEAPAPAPAAPAATGAVTTAAGALGDAIAAAIAAHASHAPAPLDESRVIELVIEHAPKPAPLEVIVRVNEQPEVRLERQHFLFPLLLAVIAARVPAFLVGAAGTGKTSAAHAASTALGLDYSAISVSPMTSKADLFGMRDAAGTYHRSEMVRLASEGGVFLFDEFDAGHAGVLTGVNMLLANGSFATPEGMHTRHADFVPLFALNTYGNGASREYVGRNQLDAATLDRGAFLDWRIDAGLEAAFVGVNEASPSFDLAAGGVPTAPQWLDAVRAFRRAVEAHKIRAVVSPRAVLHGSRLAAAGVGREHLCQMLLFKGMDADTLTKVKSSVL